MKIICDACGTRYSLPDDKVAAGRTFKIRCKRCSNVIVVRGAEVAVAVDPLAPPPASPPDPDALWYVVIDQEQVGPLTVDELAAHVAAGRVGADSYVWREGLADWQPVSLIAELAGLGLAAAPVVEDAEAPLAPPAAALRGERNESSVLFTLGNLAQLAAPAKLVAGPGGPVEEGSGLIDIRSMASAYHGDRGTPRPAAGATIGSIDDLPVFAASAFVEPAVLIPSRRPAARTPLVPVLVALVVGLAVAATVMVVLLVRQDPAPPPVAAPEARAAMPAPGPEAPRSDATAMVGSGSGSAAVPGSGSGSAAEAPPPPPPAPIKERSVRPATPRERERDRERERERVAVPDPVPGSRTPPRPRETCDQITCVANDYKGDCCAPFRPTGERMPPVDSRAGLPETLELGAVRNGMASVRARIIACGSRSSVKGEVRVAIKVDADGRVSSTTVKATPDPVLGTCVEAAIKKATFARTQKGGGFTYPWKF
jgi:predicted Zn finger-like uncharacterized protein